MTRRTVRISQGDVRSIRVEACGRLVVIAIHDDPGEPPLIYAQLEPDEADDLIEALAGASHGRA